MSTESHDENMAWYRSWWVGGWIWPIGVTLATLIWVYLCYALIGDRPRDWQYGTVPYVPGSSAFPMWPSQPGEPPYQVTLPD